MEKQLILINESDEVIGYGEKLLTHQRRQLHRAFSIFVFDKYTKKLLLQQRALNKYHSGGLWSNTCCSHPYKGESLIQSLSRCMLDEIGITLMVPDYYFIATRKEETIICKNGIVEFAGKYRYSSSYGELGEDEIDYVFTFLPDLRTIDSIVFNPAEINALKWTDLTHLEKWFTSSPNQFTSWFCGTYSIVRPFLISAMEASNN